MTPKSGWEPGNWNARHAAYLGGGGGGGTPLGKRRGKRRKPTRAEQSSKGIGPFAWSRARNMTSLSCLQLTRTWEGGEVWRKLSRDYGMRYKKTQEADKED